MSAVSMAIPEDWFVMTVHPVIPLVVKPLAFSLLLSQARTLYDYETSKEDELSFKANELLIVLSGDDGSGW